MEEVIKYFEALEARIAALEEAQQTDKALIAALKAEIEALKNRPMPEPQVVEKIVEKIVEKPVEQPAEKPVEQPVEILESPEPEIANEPEQTVTTEPAEQPAEPADPVIEEKASPKAAVYGKAVDDIRQAISLGDRFLYQRELFGQNAELMQRTLTELNALSSFNQAMEYIVKHFQWDTESNSYQQFIVTLHRRFG